MPRGVLLDIRGVRFGRAVAVKRLGYKKGWGSIWLLRCDCGREFEEGVGNLRAGRRTSCGCLVKEHTISRNKERRGPKSDNWRGGQTIAGSIPWANLKIYRNKASAKKHGYTPLMVSAEDLATFYNFHDKHCDICGVEISAGRHSLHVDHDHGTGELRGFLCGPCNRMLGLSRDKSSVLRNAIAYIAGAPAKYAA
jgi:hypothetical protein